MWHDVDGMGWWMIAGTVWMLFFAIIVVWVISRLTPGPAPGARDALDIAKERYARGEISSEELAEIRRNLAG
jgi:putative membrane protein